MESSQSKLWTNLFRFSQARPAFPSGQRSRRADFKCWAPPVSRRVRSLMMSPDKGSPFNSRWEEGEGGCHRLGKSNQIPADMRLILGEERKKCFQYNICISYICCLFQVYEGLKEDYSLEGCRACRVRRAPRKGGRPRQASTTPGSRA